MSFRVVVTSVRCSGRYLIGRPSVHPFDGPVPTGEGSEFATLANARGYVGRELGAISSYWRAEIVDADGVTVQTGHRSGLNGSGRRFVWSDVIELDGDERAVAREVYAVQRGERDHAEITDGCARVIGSWFAVGMGPGQSFASTGAIVTDDPSDLWEVMAGREYRAPNTPRWLRDALDCFGTYLVARIRNGATGPVDGWSNVWVR